MSSKDTHKKKRIDVPGVLVGMCEPNLEKRGYGSLSELVRSLLRDWAEKMKQEELNKLTGQQFLETRQKEMKLIQSLKNMLEEGEVDKARDTLAYLLGEENKTEES